MSGKLEGGRSGAVCLVCLHTGYVMTRSRQAEKVKELRPAAKPQSPQSIMEALEQLRAHCLGQDRPLAALVPGGADLPPERLAEQIADVLMFHLGRLVDWTDEELRSSWRWLRAAALFLWSCAPEDRTPYGLLRLANLTREGRESLELSDFPVHYASDLAELPPLLKQTLEAAVWLLTEPTPQEVQTLEGLLK